MFYVEFPQVQHIDLSELIHVLNAVAIVTSVLLNLLTSGQSLFDSYGVPWMEVKPRFRGPEKTSLSPE